MQLATTVQESLIQEINRIDEEALCLERDVGERAIKWVNLRRGQGLLLMELRDSVSHGRWQSMFRTAEGKSNSNARFGFDYMTGHRYMKLAKAYPETISDDRVALQASKDMWGNYPQLPNGDAPTQLHDNNFFIAFGRKIMSATDLWEKQMQINPVSQWSTETAQQFVDELSGLIERINAIYEQAKHHLETAI